MSLLVDIGSPGNLAGSVWTQDMGYNAMQHRRQPEHMQRFRPREVMGVGTTFAEAYGKAELGASDEIPSKGTAFVSVRERDKDQVPELAKQLSDLGFKLVATKGTAKIIEQAGVPVTLVNKVQEGRPHIVDMIKSDKIDLIINTTEGRQAISDSSAIRSSAEQHRVYYTTTMAGGDAVCQALSYQGGTTVRRIQTLHKEIV